MKNPENASNKGDFKSMAIRFFKFVGFSLGAGIIEFVSFTLLKLFGEQNETWLVIAEVSSVVLSCLFNFTLNRKFTFKSANNLALGMVLYGVFYLIVTPLGAQFILWLTRSGWDPFVAKVVKMLLNFLLDFSYCNFVLFRKSNKKKQSDTLCS